MIVVYLDSSHLGYLACFMYDFFFGVALYCAVRAACHFQGEPFTVPKTIYLETKFQLVPGLGYGERLDMVIVGSSFFCKL